MRISDWSSDVCSSDLPLKGKAEENEETEGAGKQKPDEYPCAGDEQDNQHSEEHEADKKRIHFRPLDTCWLTPNHALQTACPDGSACNYDGSPCACRATNYSATSSRPSPIPPHATRSSV